MIAPIRSVTWYSTRATVQSAPAGASDLDPNATFLAFLTAIEENDVLGAQDAAEYLATWLGNGGFEPKWLPEEKDAFLIFVAEVHVYAN